MGVEGVDLGELAVVEEFRQACACGQLATFLLRFDALFATAEFGG